MSIIKLLATLYRADVFFITFMASIAGEYMVQKSVSPLTFLKAFFISGLLYNFVYTLNSITDLKEDRINNPGRPLPSGRLPIKYAIYYLVFLTLFSICGSLFLFSGTQLFFAFFVLFMGYAYSVPPLTLKKIPIAASFVTGWGMAHPLFITGNSSIYLFALAFILFASGVTMMKDLTDIEGDRAAGRKVITDIISLRSISLLSLSSMVTGLGILIFLKEFVIIIVPLSGIFTLTYFILFRKNYEKKIYKILIKAAGISLLLALAVMIIPQFTSF